MLNHNTFVPKSVKAIAILFFAISKFGDTVKHLNHKKQNRQHQSHLLTIKKRSLYLPAENLDIPRPHKDYTVTQKYKMFCRHVLSRILAYWTLKCWCRTLSDQSYNETAHPDPEEILGTLCGTSLFLSMPRCRDCSKSIQHHMYKETRTEIELNTDDPSRTANHQVTSHNMQ